jgi:hypothetical protein
MLKIRDDGEGGGSNLLYCSVGLCEARMGVNPPMPSEYSLIFTEFILMEK